MTTLLPATRVTDVPVSANVWVVMTVTPIVPATPTSPPLAPATTPMTALLPVAVTLMSLAACTLALLSMNASVLRLSTRTPTPTPTPAVPPIASVAATLSSWYWLAAATLTDWPAFGEATLLVHERFPQFTRADLPIEAEVCVVTTATAPEMLTEASPPIPALTPTTARSS